MAGDDLTLAPSRAHADVSGAREFRDRTGTERSRQLGASVSSGTAGG